MRLAFSLEYDGTDFSGFQSQKNAPTIQDNLEDALKKITNENNRLTYSGRTDAGVHALSQVCDFETNIERSNEDWINGINSNLPSTISVKDIFKVPDTFNSRFSAIERKYSYVIYNSSNKPLFIDRHIFWVRNNLDIQLMKREMKSFEGKNDFSSFRSSSCNSKNPIKTIKDIELRTFNDFIIITVIANAFLHNMVRIMVGTLVDIAKKENNMSIRDILEKKDRSFAGKTAPASGLFFLGPRYPDEFKINTCEKDIFDRYKTNEALN